MKEFRISKDNSGQRIDRFLRKEFMTLPLSTIYKFIRKKLIKVNHQKTNEKYLLQEGDILELFVKLETIENLSKESIKLRDLNFAKVKPSFQILFEDEHLLIVDKPPNIAVHSGTTIGHNNLINQILTYLRYNNKEFKPALVHRLDMQTSGIIIAAKNMEALQKMNDLIKKRLINKYYMALIIGRLPRTKGIIKTKLLRNYSSQNKFKVTNVESDENAKESITKYEELKTWKDKFTLLKLELITGRTHQIRAHLYGIEHPIVGDETYGNFETNKYFHQQIGLKRQFLHAVSVSFIHPITNETLNIIADLPKDLSQTIDFLNKKYA